MVREAQGHLWARGWIQEPSQCKGRALRDPWWTRWHSRTFCTSSPIILTAALSVRDLMAHFAEGEQEAESPHRARSQTQVLSHVLLPSCAAFRCGFRFRGKFCFHVIPSLPPDRWPVGGGHAGTPGCNTTKKTREENLWETYALKRDFLRPERVFIEKFYRN